MGPNPDLCGSVRRHPANQKFAMDVSFSHQCFPPSLPPSLPLSLKVNKIFEKIGTERID